MRLKTLASVLLIPILLSSCSLLGQRQVEVVTKPVQIDIAQPAMPRPIDLKEPKWYVVSDATIIEACLKDPETGKGKKVHEEKLWHSCRQRHLVRATECSMSRKS